MSQRTVIYVGDPMCSWCWGFAPTMRDIVAATSERCGVSIVLGGLRSETGPVPPQRLAMYRELWPRITQLTGQPFHCDLVESPDFAYDTEPACRAVVTVRSMKGDLRAWEMFDRLQSSFYVESLDISQADCCARIAAELDLEAEQFLTRFSSDELKSLTQRDFHRARALGASGFPTVLVDDGNRSAVLTHGYRPFAELQGPLLEWLAETEADVSG